MPGIGGAIAIVSGSGDEVGLERVKRFHVGLTTPHKLVAIAIYSGSCGGGISAC